MICTNCLENEGLKIEALKVAKKAIDTQCSNCQQYSGYEIDKDNVHQIMANFFVVGSTSLTDGGWASRFQFNEYEHDYKIIEPSAQKDAELLKKEFGLSVFLYGPQMWRLGMTKYLDPFDDKESISKKAPSLIKCCKTKILPKGIKIFRFRLGLQNNFTNASTYDSPTPEQKKEQFQRFDSKNVNIFYACFSHETCIHESKTSIDDEIYLATLTANKDLRIIDLTDVEENALNFSESVVPTIHYITATTGSMAYNYCKIISEEIKNMGYDGFVYPSFFSKVKDTKPSNLCLFDFPIKENKLSLISINRIRITNVDYHYTMGPLINSQD